MRSARPRALNRCGELLRQTHGSDQPFAPNKTNTRGVFLLARDYLCPKNAGPARELIPCVTINLGNAPEDKLVFDCGPPKQAKKNLDAETEQ